MSIESVLAIPHYAYGDNQAACEAFAELRKAAAELRRLRDLAIKVIEWDDARRRFVDHGFMGDAHEADRLGVEIVADARELTSVSSGDSGQ